MNGDIVIALKGGNHIFARASGEVLRGLTEQFAAICNEQADKGVLCARSDDCVLWAVRTSEVAGFYVRPAEPSLSERQIEAMEKLAKAAEKQAGEGEDWRGDA